MNNLIINFGKKHKQKNIEEVFLIDPNYCKWLSSQPFIKQYGDIYKFIFSKFHNEKEIYLEFGRYKNKPLSYILKNDMKYIYYLHSCNYVKILYPKLFKTLDYIIKNVKIDDYY